MKLEIIDFGNNEIVEILTDTFSDLINLKNIILKENKIIRINSKAFNNLSKLELVDLSYNDIKEITELFHVTDSLEIIDFSENQISEIQVDVFSGLKNLKNINLS